MVFFFQRKYMSASKVGIIWLCIKMTHFKNCNLERLLRLQWWSYLQMTHEVPGHTNMRKWVTLAHCCFSTYIRVTWKNAAKKINSEVYRLLFHVTLLGKLSKGLRKKKGELCWECTKSPPLKEKENAGGRSRIL